MSIMIGYDSSGGTVNRHWVHLCPVGRDPAPSEVAPCRGRLQCAYCPRGRIHTSAGGPSLLRAAQKEVQRLRSP